MDTFKRSAALALAAVVAMAGCSGKDGSNGANGSNGSNGTNGLGYSSGLLINVTGVTVAADGTVTASFTMKDDQGNAVDKAGVYSQGAVAPRFSLVQVASNTAPFVNITTTSAGAATTQLNTANSGTGTLTEVAAKTGNYTYVFPSKYTNLAAGGADAAKSTTLMIQATRTVDTLDPRTVYVRNVEFDFMPSGSGTPINREIVLTSNCNKCHAPLAIHGGGRRDAKFCGTCHNPTALVASYGQGWDLGQFVHTIHGAQVDPVTGDWSTVTYPQPIDDCATCHAGAALGDNFKTNPTKMACTGCHTRVKFDGSAAGSCSALAYPTPCNHITTTSPCTQCHAATDIAGYHTPAAPVWPAGDAANTAPVTTLKIDSVSIASGVPTVTFTVKTGYNGATPTGRDLAARPFESFSIIRGMALAGVGRNFEFDYPEYASTKIYDTAVPPNLLATSTGTAGQYTMVLPALPTLDSKGVAYDPTADGVAFGLEGADGNGSTVEIAAAASDLYWIKLNGSTTGVNKRRTVVETAKCLACHGSEFGFHHAGDRNNVQTCSVCHLGTVTNSRNSAKFQIDAISGTNVAPASQTIQLATMIHKLHTGEASGDASWVYRGYDGTALERATYPGNRMQCDQCHVTPTAAGSANWGLPGAAVPATVKTEVWTCNDANPAAGVACVSKSVVTTTQTKSVAICGGCHDSSLVQAHMEQNVVDVGGTATELCSLCHDKYGVGDPLGAHYATPR